MPKVPSCPHIPFLGSMLIISTEGAYIVLCNPILLTIAYWAVNESRWANKILSRN